MDLPFETDEDRGGTGSGGTLASSVLVVDDEPVVLDVFRRLFKHDQDLAISTAESAEAALNFLRDRRFDLLITDKNLPGMGGVELISEARKVRPAIAAIMITGYASGESVIAAFAAGATDYLTKPFADLKIVRAKIRAALERRAERVKDHEVAKLIARQAADLLAQGKVVPDPIWEALENQFSSYERAISEGGKGVVRVVGRPKTVALLAADPRFEATSAEPGDPALATADVVVIDTADLAWRALADRLGPAPTDVLLLAHADADLADLLEAISLHLDLVGFGASEADSASALREKIRAVLMRRAVQRAQAGLSSALDAFRDALKNA